jgi:hypothetical protein
MPIYDSFIFVLKADDIVSLIIIVIIIAISIISKIMEVIKGDDTKPKVSLDEVNEYLKEIKETSLQSTEKKQEYTLNKQETYSQYDEKYQAKKQELESRKTGRKQEKIKKAKQDAHQIKEAILIKPDNLAESPVITSIASEKKIKVVPVIIQNIMNEKRFSDTQKGVIFHELFSKPKCLLKKN